MNELPASLLDYVKSQLANSVAPEAIRDQLLNGDWPVDQVEAAFQLLMPTVPAQYNQLATPQTQPKQMQPSSFWQPTAGLDIFLHWLFRLGFASIFLVNSVTAWLHPASFVELLHAFPPAQWVGHTDLLLILIGVNDLILGLLILMGIGKKFVWTWAGVWFAIVTIVKFFSL